MIAETYRYVYHCWKCHAKYRIEQSSPDEQTDLKCKCGKTLLRMNRSPGLVTDSTFMSGSDDGFGNAEWVRKRAIAKAKAAGVDVNGARYCPELCPKGESLSPKAWVKSRADVARRAQELGCGVEGSVNAPAPTVEPEEEKPYRVADWIVDRRVEKKIEEIGGDVTPKEREELWHKEADLASGNG